MTRRRASRTPPARVTPRAVAAYWARDDDLLRAELRLPPWAVSPLDVDDGPCPWPKGTAGHETWGAAQVLREELEQEAKE